MRWGDRVGERERRIGEESRVGGAVNLGLRRMLVSFSYIHMCMECTKHPLFVECGERLFWSSAPELFAVPCTEWKGVEYEGFIFCKTNSSIFSWYTMYRMTWYYQNLHYIPFMCGVSCWPWPFTMWDQLVLWVLLPTPTISIRRWSTPFSLYISAPNLLFADL